MMKLLEKLKELLDMERDYEGAPLHDEEPGK
jgi:hypothetical protein